MQLPDPTGGWLLPDAAGLLAGGALGVTAPLLAALARSPRAAAAVVAGGAAASGACCAVAVLGLMPDAVAALDKRNPELKLPYAAFLLGAVLLPLVERLGLAWYACRRRSAPSSARALGGGGGAAASASARERREQAGRLWWATPQQAQPLLSQLASGRSAAASGFQPAPWLPPDVTSYGGLGSAAASTPRSAPAPSSAPADETLSLSCVVPSAASAALQIRIDFLREAEAHLRYDVAAHAATVVTQPHRHEDVVDFAHHGTGARHTHFGEGFALLCWGHLLLGVLAGAALGFRTGPGEGVLLSALCARKTFERVPQLAASTRHRVGPRRVAQLVAVAGADAVAYALARAAAQSADPPSDALRGVWLALAAGALLSTALVEESLDEFTEDGARVFKFLAFAAGGVAGGLGLVMVQ